MDRPRRGFRQSCTIAKVSRGRLGRYSGSRGPSVSRAPIDRTRTADRSRSNNHSVPTLHRGCQPAHLPKKAPAANSQRGRLQAPPSHTERGPMAASKQAFHRTNRCRRQEANILRQRDQVRDSALASTPREMELEARFAAIVPPRLPRSSRPDSEDTPLAAQSATPAP